MSVPAQGILGPVLKYTVCSGIRIYLSLLGGKPKATATGCMFRMSLSTDQQTTQKWAPGTLVPSGQMRRVCLNYVCVFIH